MSDCFTISGRACTGEDLEVRDVEIVVENGIISEINDKKNVPDRWIFPGFFNSHTHLADTVAMDAEVFGSLSELVAPPDGLKHRILRKTPPEVLKEAMVKSIEYMKRSATFGFCDFREGGVTGAGLLKEALKETGSFGIILGREGGEDISDGIGISSTKEGPQTKIFAENTRKTGGYVAFHAGEKDSRDVDSAIDAEPDLLIHMTHATDAQIKRCADMNIPIVICPRSNHALGVSDSDKYPPVKRMLEYGCRVLLGTDNVMFVQPDMLSEMSFLSYAYRTNPNDTLRMAVQGSEIFGKPFFIGENKIAAFFSVMPADSNLRFSLSPIKTIVNRVNLGMIERTYFKQIKK
ncbi:cytosine/adenosine deaminase-related metal-dependent hydrolase [Methanomicrobium sp. W14]|uniref:amidohydrolase family protein n=1 Tax=Methanomicrobium sp. W14 TaxID=2817839 RepID=UPI001AE22EE0|nr:amidohydrolase family protein [Methanomicrobium sp. W14]MBP2132329.1 cytosine/adenosine deaminase-related metal-dependent hydrolase [Methanomicrobium sp. W14]